MSNDEILTLEEREAQERREKRVTIIALTSGVILYLLICIVCPIISIGECVKVITAHSFSGDIPISVLMFVSVIFSNLLGVDLITFKLICLQQKGKKKKEKISSVIKLLLIGIYLLFMLMYADNHVALAGVILTISCLGIILNMVSIIILGKDVIH